MKDIKTVAIIWSEWHFGKFLSNLILEKFDIELRRYDISGDFAEADLLLALQSNVVILSIPIPHIIEFLTKNIDNIWIDSIVVNISSIQKYIYDNITSKFPKLCVLFMHPMFGPQTYSKTTKKLKIINCWSQNISDLEILECKNFLESNIYTDVIIQTADEHDYQQANSQFLTMLISMICKNGEFMDINISNGTVAYEELMNIMNIYKEDYTLTHDIYKYNPYCNDVIKNIHLWIEKSKNSLYNY